MQESQAVSIVEIEVGTLSSVPRKTRLYTLSRLPCMSILRLELERFRLGLVAPRVSSEEAWCVVEEGIKVLVNVF